MKKIITALLLTASLFIISGCADNSNKNTNTNASPSASATIKQTAPDFTYTDLATGKEVKLSDLRGKPVFLNFWATWCPPCVKELPLFAAKYPEYKDKIQFVAVSIDESIAEPKEFVQSKKIQLPFAHVEPAKVGTSYQLEAIPTSVLIDSDGNIINKMVGGMNETMLTEFLKPAL